MMVVVVLQWVIGGLSLITVLFFAIVNSFDDVVARNAFIVVAVDFVAAVVIRKTISLVRERR